MEKGDYSVNDLKHLFNSIYFEVGDILYFRNADIVKDYGSTYNIEIKVRVIRVASDKLFVECISYYDGHNEINTLSLNAPHIVEKNDFKYLFRNSKFF